MVEISNSEVETFQQCEKKHYYAFGLGLQRNHGLRSRQALEIGLAGHEALEVYYKALMSGEPHHTAMGCAIVRINQIADPDIKATVAERFPQYMLFAANDPWKPVEVEQQHTLHLFDDVHFRFTPDLIVELTEDMDVETAGNDYVWLAAGDQVIIDHKWTGRFFNNYEAVMQAQLAKYMYALRVSGYPVKAVMLNQIHTAKGPRDLFNRTWIAPSDTRLAAVMNEHVKAAKRIAPVNQMRIEKYQVLAERSMSRYNCGGCDFRAPCSTELNGGNTEQILASYYERNDYVSELRGIHG